MSQGTSTCKVGGSAVNPAPIRCSFVTKKQLDNDLSEFLELFRNNGTAANYGVLLVESLPVSRPHPLGHYRISRADPWPVSTMTSSPKIEGLYTLKKHDLQVNDKNWPEQAEAAFTTSSVSSIDLSQFLEALRGGGNLGAQVENLPALYGGVSVRSQLNIKMFPTTIGSTLLRAVSPIGTRDLLNGGYITISTPASATAMQKSVAELTMVIYHHRGSPKLWIVVPPAENGKLENHIRHVFADMLGEGQGGGLCSQFVKHLSLWITPDLLQSWGIKFHQVLLREKQMLFLFPSSYYWGVSTGFSVIEMKAIAGPKWELNGYRFCAPSNPLCKAVQPNAVVFTISQKAIDDAVAAEATRKAKTAREAVKRSRSAKRDDRSESPSNPPAPGASASYGDESFGRTASVYNAPNNDSPQPQHLMILRKRPRSPSPGAATTPPANTNTNTNTNTNPAAAAAVTTAEPPLSSSTTSTTSPLNETPLQLLESENAILRAQNARLLATARALAAREARYERALAQHRAYHGHLEAELAKEAPSVLLWKNAALKAYRLVQERDGRVEGLERRVGELELVLEGRGGGGGGGAGEG